MMEFKTVLRSVLIPPVPAAALGVAACANNPADNAQANAAGMATPGSQQDFVVNVGDRVFFETDSSDLTPQARATLDKQAQWLGQYNRPNLPLERQRAAR